MPKKLTKEEETARVLNMYSRERELRNDGISVIAGVDEAGRGPLAGAVFAAAVVFDGDEVILGLNDSKKLSEKRREELYDIICEKAAAYAVFSVDEKRIDDINILNATFEAMRGAVSALAVTPQYALIDGNRISGMSVSCETIVKGDAKSASIAAASILAKVSRDRYICALAEKYPEYGFGKHKGYGTKEHIEAILKYGPCEIHRKTFLKKILGEQK
ncbi:MAG: ribonuclease HII [Firmicutes bacterium]|nr:ribonuclease HII [Bacillota bacterium]